MIKKCALFLLAAGIYSSSIFAQEGKKYNFNNKGKLYVYWGWNLSAYSQSDIHFKGKNYNFTLYDVIGRDRQTPGLNEYVNPSTITIPQYNARIGYFINDKYSISIGNDHMKYVMKTGQTAVIDGVIDAGTIYDKVYDNEEIEVAYSFLIFEHTDGLNYENFDFRRHFRVKQIKDFSFDAFAGIGAGIMLPKTNVTLFEGERYDEFHVSGYGVNLLAGANITYRGRYFIMSEIKGGYTNLPDIRISHDKFEKASQELYFFQYNILFGVNFQIKNTAKS